MVHAHQLVELRFVVHDRLHFVHIHENLVDVPVKGKNVEQHFVFNAVVNVAHQKRVQASLRVVDFHLIQRNARFLFQRKKQSRRQFLVF